MAQKIEGFKIVFEGVEQILKSYNEINEAHKKQLKALRDIKETSSDAYKDQLKVVKALTEEKKRLNDELKADKKVEAEVIKQVGAYKELTLAIKLNEKSVKDMAASGDKLSDSYIELKNNLKKLKREKQQIDDSTKLEKATVNKTTGAYKKLSDELGVARKKTKDLAAAGDTASDEYKSLIKVVQKLDKELKKIDSSVGQSQRSVGDYASHWSGAKNALGSIPIAGMLATGGIAALGEVLIQGGVAVKELTDEFRALRGSVNDVFSGSDEEIDQYTVQIASLRDTFVEVSPEELITATAALTNQTGDYGESLDLVNKILLVNKNNQGEALSQVSEYSNKMKDAGATAGETAFIISKSFRDGTFNDTGIDAFNEGIISLRERTPATVAAIEKIGISSVELNKMIDEKGVGGALTEVSKKTALLSADSTEAAGIMADVFRGAGETSGMTWLASLGDMEGGIDSLIDKTDEQTEHLINTKAANDDFNQSILELTESFGGAGSGLDVLWIKTKTFFVDLLSDAIEQMDFFFGTFGPILTALKNLANNFGVAGNGTDILRKGLKILMIPLNETLKGIRALGGGLVWLGNKFPKIGKLFKANTKETVNNTKSKKENAKAVKAEMDEMAKVESNLKKATNSKKKYTKSTKEQKKEVALATTSLAFMNKELQKLKKELSEQPDLNGMVAIDAKIQETEDKISAAKRALIDFKNNISDSMGEGELLGSKRIGALDVEEGDGFSDSANESIDEATEANRLQLKEQAAQDLKDNAALEDELREQAVQKGLEAANALNDAVLAIRLRPHQMERLEIEKTFEAKIKAAEGDKELQAKLSDEKAMLLEKLNAKENKIKRQAAIAQKALAVAEIGWNTFKAAQSAMGMLPPFGAILAASITAIGVANIAKTIATPIPFAEGGLVGGGNIPRQQNGDNVLATLMTDEVVLTPENRNRIGDSNLAAAGVKGFAEGGKVDDSVPNISAGNDNFAMMFEKMDTWQSTFVVMADSQEIVQQGLKTEKNSRKLTI